MDLLQRVQALIDEVQQAQLTDERTVQQFHQRFIGSKSVVKELMGALKNLPGEQKKEFGQQINRLKDLASTRYQQAVSLLPARQKHPPFPDDPYRPGEPIPLGARHPVSVVRQEIVRIFERIGFEVADGPEVEDDWHNFTALNTPADHPARDLTDTFYVEGSGQWLLRSQTSNVQIRFMEQHAPPIRIIAPGRVYRNETITYKSHVFFHQIEGLCVAEGVSFADLKQTVLYFVEAFFGTDYDVRMRASYFPFTEISAEVDIRRKGSDRWLEIMGCGMVHPQVLRNCHIDPQRYSGFAFGMGIERPTMLKYGIHDIRILYENDIRMLSQFRSA